MAALKKLLTGVVIGLVAGLWMGVNIGKQRPILSNPFSKEEKSLKEQAKEKVGEAKEKMGEVIKDTKKAIREKLEDEETKNNDSPKP
jgi:uncharacterized membrane protein YraQ (UPF0718 family)